MVYYSRSVVAGSVVSAFRVFVDETIMKHNQNSTVKEASRQQESDTWTLSLTQLDAFIGLLYARGILGKKILN